MDTSVLLYLSALGLLSTSPADVDAQAKRLDCRGVTVSGVYNVYTHGVSGYHDVYCDGEWMVIQRRQDGSEHFYRNWKDYRKGFGDVTGEFWLGNDALAAITSRDKYELKIDMWDFSSGFKVVKYSTFKVGPENTKYTLTLGTFSEGTGSQSGAGNSLAHHNGRQFTTLDRDNDANSINCAHRYKGGWWYGSCHSANLNGLYHGAFTSTGSHVSYADGVNWRSWHGYHYSLKKTEMKIRKI